MRQIFLDTETTGFEFKEGHRIIEFGAVEMVDRKLTGRHLHLYFKPDIAVDEGAFAVHGISNAFLADKPLFEDCVDELMDFIQGGELIIHNAGFDVPFLNWELNLIKPNRWGMIEDHCQILDTLIMARKRHPGQRNSLDALCKRYFVNNQHRDLHGALLDAEILADVYLAMTGGQTDMMLEIDFDDFKANQSAHALEVPQRLTKMALSHEQRQSHQAYLALLSQKSSREIKW